MRPPKRPVYWRHSTRWLWGLLLSEHELSLVDCNDKTRMPPRCPTSSSCVLVFLPNLSAQPPNRLLPSLAFQNTDSCDKPPPSSPALAQQQQPKGLPKTASTQDCSVARHHSISSGPCHSYTKQDLCQTNLPKFDLPDLQWFCLVLPVQDTMTVALLVSHPGSMPGYSNTVDLDEVQSLSRYCFLFSTHRDCVFCFFHVGRIFMYLSFRHVTSYWTSDPNCVGRVPEDKMPGQSGPFCKPGLSRPPGTPSETGLVRQDKA